MRIVYPWLCELVDVPADPDQTAHELALRGFEVADVEHGSLPVIDFEITANRPDCLSHVGLAREASVVWGRPLTLPEAVWPPREPAGPVEVQLADASLCPRYCAQVFEVAVKASPGWLTERLLAGGVRPINTIVDVTNYVLLERGQPMHAFDLERLAGQRIVVRRATPGERLRTLDGVDRELDPEMLVIADAEHAAAIGGVMGGEASEVRSTTRTIVLESAYFHPPSVRRTSKRLGLKTEASIRFERGGDINAPPAGIARAAALLARLDAGRPLGALIDCYPAPRQPPHVHLRASRISRLLGHDIPSSEVPRILEPLGFGIGAASDGSEPGWSVTVPSFRVDVAREVDLIEEVGRHYGFDRLPVTFPALATPQGPPDAGIGQERLVRQILTAAGFSESITFAFVEGEAARPFCSPGAEPVPIANPLSEKFAVLRPSLLPGLIDSCAHNRRRERKDVRLFESGNRFPVAGEGRAAAFVWCGAAEGPHWSAPARSVDFFDAKGVVEVLARAFGWEAEAVPVEVAFLVNGRSAEVRARRNGAGRMLGVVGQLLPTIAEARGFPAAEPIFAAELDLDALAAASARDDLKAESLPRFPSIVRDISILVDEVLPAAAVRGTIRAAAPPTLVSVVEFDRYQGKGIPEGRVSLSLRLTFRASDRTLTDADAQEATDRILDALRSSHAAEQR